MNEELNSTLESSVNTNIENDNTDIENNDLTGNDSTTSTNENLNNFTIFVDGKESNYLIESYKEMKITNLYLNLILIFIVLFFVLSKFYYFCKKIFRVNF